MKTNYQGFEESVITIEADETLSEAGALVKILENGKAAKCAEGENFCGVSVSVRGGFAGVQLSGYVQLPLSGSCAAGYQKLTAGADGAVKSADTGREYLVLESAGGEVGFLL